MEKLGISVGKAQRDLQIPVFGEETVKIPITKKLHITLHLPKKKLWLFRIEM